MARRINLVPQSERVRTTTDFGKLIMGVLIVLVLFGVGITYYLLNNQLSSKESELADIRQQVEQLKSQTAALERYAQLDQERARAETSVQEVYAGRTLVAELLDSLSLVVSEDTWFQIIEIGCGDPVSTQGPGAVTGSAEGPAVGALAIGGYTYSYEEVADMMVRLKLVSTIKAVALDVAQTAEGENFDPADVKRFEISAALVNDQPPDTPLPLSQVEVDH